MSNHKSRLAKLEAQRTAQELPAWAELLDDNRAILRYQDGRRIEASRADIPQGVKVYQGFSPDDWDTVRPIDYRAGIVPGIQAAAGAIGIRFTEPKPPKGEA